MRIAALIGPIIALGLFGVAAAQPPTLAAYDGLKKTVSVDKFLAAESVGGTVTADGMTAMLIDALVRDGRFVVVEPSTPTVVGAPPTGDVVAASAVIRGTVTKYEAAARGGGLQLGGMPFGSGLGGMVGAKHQTAVMEISLRLVDAATGLILATSRAEGAASSSGVDANIVSTRTGLSTGANAFAATPIGKAGEAAIAKAVDQITAAMRNVPWSAMVVETSDGKVYVNAGADRHMQLGMALHVYRRGKVLRDPANGMVLDVELTTIGVIQINGVRERLSTATIVSGEAPQRGDLLKLD